MNKKVYNLLKFLLENNETHSIEELSEKYSVSIRSIRNYISIIDDFLSTNQSSNLLERKGGRIRFSGTPKEAAYLLETVINSGFYEYKLSPKEREFVIIFTLLMNNDATTLLELENILFTSKVTILKDIKQVINFFTKYHVAFSENKHKGFLLDIDEFTRRKLIYITIKNLEFPLSQVFESQSQDIRIWFVKHKLNIDSYWEKIKTALSITEQHFKVDMNDNDYYDIILTIYIQLYRLEQNHMLPPNCVLESIPEKKYIKIAAYLMKLLKTDDSPPAISQEILYLSNSLQEKRFINSGNLHLTNSIDFYILVKGFLYRLSSDYNINFSEDYNLQEFLTAHITHMYHRLKEGDVLTNPFKTQLMMDYALDYQLIKKNIFILEEHLNYHLSDDEITYILMHIAAARERMMYSKRIPRVILICHGGFGTSHFLAETLNNHFKINIVDILSSHNAQSIILVSPQEIMQKCDFIITTVPLTGAPVPWLKVNTILTPENIADIFKIISDIRIELPGENCKKNISERNTDMFVSNILQKKSENHSRATTLSHISFSSLLAEGAILLDKIADDWKSAIISAGEPLLWSQKITAEYLRAMINNLLINGPYYVFAPHVAIAHAAPSDGALKIGASFLRVKNPVAFGHKLNDPVRFITAISLPEPEEHLDMLFKTMNMLSDKKILDELEHAADAGTVIDIFKTHESA